MQSFCLISSPASALPPCPPALWLFGRPSREGANFLSPQKIMTVWVPVIRAKHTAAFTVLLICSFPKKRSTCRTKQLRGDTTWCRPKLFWTYVLWFFCFVFFTRCPSHSQTVYVVAFGAFAGPKLCMVRRT